MGVVVKVLARSKKVFLLLWILVDHSNLNNYTITMTLAETFLTV